ncbi:MAG: RNA polymerase sigma factor [Gammaproteobacteria bacterium]
MQELFNTSLLGDKNHDENVIKSLVGATDEYIIQVALTGDRRAYDVLYQRYKKRVLVICTQFCGGDRDLASDLCQEAFIQAFSRLDQLKDRKRFFYWLSEIAKNKHISFIRKEKTLTKVMSQYEVIKNTLLDNDNEFTDAEINVVDELIKTISNQDIRTTVQLFYIDGKKTSEIVDIQGISLTTVTTRLNRFRAKFRMRIVQEIIKRRE